MKIHFLCQILSDFDQLLQLAPIKLSSFEVILLFAGTQGYLDDIEIKDISRFEQQYLEFMRTSRAKLVQELKDKKDIPEGLEKKIRKAVEDFKESFSA